MYDELCSYGTVWEVTYYKIVSLTLQHLQTPSIHEALSGFSAPSVPLLNLFFSFSLPDLPAPVPVFFTYFIDPLPFSQFHVICASNP